MTSHDLDKLALKVVALDRQLAGATRAALRSWSRTKKATGGVAPLSGPLPEATPATATATAAATPAASSDDASGRRRRRRGGRGRRQQAGYEAALDHGDEGYGFWLDGAVRDDPVFAEHWAGRRALMVRIEADQIIVRPDDRE